MTSKFSIDNRELLQRISSGEAVVGIDFGNLIVRELAAFRLAAMDSEPVELPLDYLQGHKDGLEWAARLAEANHPETGDWLYDDPIELAKAIRKGPDMPPVQPAPVVPDDVLKALQKVARIRLDMDGFDGDRRGIADCLCDAEEALIEVVNRRAAMFQAAPVCTCPSGDGSLRWPCPVHPGNSPVVPDGIERVASMAEYLGNFAAAAIIRQLAANQPQNAPQNIPEIIPDCWCRTCRPVDLNDMRFVVCPDCGNKRCPRANDHRNSCTGSNEPGQEGSSYQDTPREVK
ncbi:hypothetical protein [Klebsiella quasipneumoniae]|uniref:hypothetical protein n=1 Tax=Klebsiella quasipneumoniae TaxID=1463165 RepID=UPI001D18351F|nr:hypothetical protein [Klebsiella quasipneumoniae]